MQIERWILQIECVGGGWLRRRASRLCWYYVWQEVWLVLWLLLRRNSAIGEWILRLKRRSLCEVFGREHVSVRHLLVVVGESQGDCGIRAIYLPQVLWVKLAA